MKEEGMRRRQLLLLAGSGALWLGTARAHHGWSSFDQGRPIYLEGRARKVDWRNPHVELELELKPDLALPADLARQILPPQAASVDGPGLLAKTTLPTRRDKLWQIELAPLTRMEAWKVEPIQPGTELAIVGFTFAGEKGDPVVRVEYLFVGGKVYGLRSAPA
jgi:Family of unknown function (DUF6152)